LTAGGGGYGSAKERSREIIERDRRLGYVSITTDGDQEVRTQAK
jgi:N-methylhydantoinase B/oxoprolinase/acetone carboxylase alpha subunit